MNDEIEYQVIIKLKSNGLSGDLYLSLEILPEGTEEAFRNVQSIPGQVPSVLMAANSILSFIESGMGEHADGLETSVTKIVTN